MAINRDSPFAGDANYWFSNLAYYNGEINHGLSAFVSITVVPPAMPVLDSATVLTYGQVINRTVYPGGAPFQYQLVAPAATIAKFFDTWGSANVASFRASDGLDIVLKAGQVARNPGLMAKADVQYTQANWIFNAATGAYVKPAATVASSHVVVSDSSANIGTSLDGLQASITHIGNISLTDTGPIAASVAQLTADAAVLAKLRLPSGTAGYTIALTDTMQAISDYGAGPHNARVVSLNVVDTALVVLSNPSLVAGGVVASVAIRDTAANIATALDTIAAAPGAYSSITITDPQNPLTISVAQLQNDAAVLARIGTSYTLKISDTAANVVANIDFLQAQAAKFGSVVLTNATSIELTAAKFIADGAVLAKIVTGTGAAASVTIADTGTAIGANLASLAAKAGSITSIRVTDNQPVTLTTADFTGSWPAVLKLQNAKILASAAGIVGNIDRLHDNLAHFTTFTVIGDSPITVSAAALLRDTDVLTRLRHGDGSSYAVTVQDTAANFVGNLAALHSSLASYTGFATLKVLADAPVTVNLANWLANGDVLTRLQHTDGSRYVVTVYDIAKSFVGNLDALQNGMSAAGNFVTYVVSNNAPITLSAASFRRDLDAISNLRHTDGSAYKVQVVATPANLVANLDALQDHLSLVSDIYLPFKLGAFPLSAAQFARDVGVLAIAHHDLGTLKLALIDTASRIGTVLGTLQANLGLIVGNIVVSDNGAIPISVAGIAANAGTLARIADANATPYRLAITDTAANALGNIAALTANTHVASIAVVDTAANVIDNAAGLTANAGSIGIVDIRDTAANIAGQLDQLQAMAGRLHDIAIGDLYNPLALSATQLTTDAASLALIHQNFKITLVDTWAHIQAGLANKPANAVFFELAVTDTTANVVAHLGEIQSTGINATYHLTDSGTPVSVADAFTIIGSGAGGATVAVIDTASAIAASQDDLIFNPNFRLGILSVTISDNAPVEVPNLGNLPNAQLYLAPRLHNADGSPVKLALIATAADINAHLAQVQANADTLAYVKIADNAPLTLSVATALDNTAALALLRQGDGTPFRLQITDNAVTISAHLGDLEAIGHLVGVYATDGPITLSVAQLGRDAATLAVLGRQYNGPSSYIDHGYQIDIRDSADHVSIALDTLEQDAAHIRTITLTDPATPLTLTAGQLANDVHALAKIDGGAYSVGIADIAANISQNFAVLEAAAVPGYVTFQGFTVTDDAPLRGTIADALFTRDNSHNLDVSFAIVDTAGNIDALFRSFDSSGLGFTPVALTVSDNRPLSLSYLVASATGVGLLSSVVNADGSSLDLTGTAAEITANLDRLEMRAADIGAVHVADNAPLVVTAAQAVTDAAVLAKVVQVAGPHNIAGAGLGTVQVTDTAAAISAKIGNLIAIQDATGLAGVYATDGLPIAMSLVQYTGGTSLAGVLGREYDTATHSNVHDYQLALIGTSSEVQAALDALQADDHVVSIALTDPAIPLVITAGQVLSNAGALARITGGYSLYVSDSGDHVAANLDALHANGHVGSISLTDAAIPLIITPAQAAADADVLAKIIGPHYVVIGDASQGIPYTGSLNVPSDWQTDVRMLSGLLTAATTGNLDYRAQAAAYTPTGPLINWTRAGFDYSATTPNDASNNVVVTLTDTLNQRSYASRFDTYTSAGTPLTQHVVYDDGSIADLTYVNGIRSHSVLTDNLAVPGTSSYSTATTDWDASGALTSRVTVYDNGDTLDQTYQPDGSRVDVTTDNGPINRAYAVETNSFNAAGQLTASNALHHNGNTEQFFYSTPGQLSRTLLADANNDEAFITTETFYSTGGTVITGQNIDFDNGVRQEWDHGASWVLRKTIVTDVDAPDPYTTITTNYNATGVLTDRTTIYDNGTQLAQLYNPDGSHTDTRTDSTPGVGGAFNYVTSSTSYDAAGRATSAHDVYDNGNTGDFTYHADGKPERSVVTDTNNDESFQTITTNFSPTAAGQTESTVYLFDNGTSWINGSAIDNTLVGGATNDIITGYDGNDTMTGGAGADMFWYNGTGWGNDVITDFQLGIDQIDLRGVSGAHPLSLLTVQSGADTVISYTNGATTSTITLQNVTATSLVPRDVLG